MALKSKKVNIELFTEKLVDVIEQNRESIDKTLITQNKIENPDIRIEGVLPCPVRVPLLEGFNTWMDENKDKFDFRVEYELKSAILGG